TRRRAPPGRRLSALLLDGDRALLGDLALRVVEDPLPQADALGRDLDELVVLDPLDGCLERHLARRRELDREVGAGRAHVREVLLHARVHDHVVLARVLAADHAAVDGDARAEEENRALLEPLERVSGRLAGFLADERAVSPARDLALVR